VSNLTVAETAEKLDRFDEKCVARMNEIRAHQEFWREAIEQGIDIPWDATYGTSHYANMAQHLDEKDNEGQYPLDPKATQIQFARVVKWARRKGWKVEKKYKDEEFTIRVTEIPEIRYMEFYSTRQVTCRKVQTGTKMVEAVDAHEEPVYEYVCDKVAFLNVATD